MRRGSGRKRVPKEEHKEEYIEGLKLSAKNIWLWFGATFQLASLHLGMSVKHIMPTEANSNSAST